MNLKKTIDKAVMYIQIFNDFNSNPLCTAASTCKTNIAYGTGIVDIIL